MKYPKQNDAARRGSIAKSLQHAADAVDSGDVGEIATHLGTALLSLSDLYLEEVFCADENAARQREDRQFSTAVLTKLAHYGIHLLIDTRYYGDKKAVQ